MKRLLILTTLVLTTAGVYAQHISEQEAMERALRYMGSGTSSITSRMAAPARDGSKELVPVQVGAKGIYAFNMEGGGYIIASADSRTLPVLGYSTTGSIDWENLPENMREWLMQYDDAIATLGNRMDFKDGNLITDDESGSTIIRKDRTPVEPLIKTHWGNEFPPYNNQAPLYAGHNPAWQGQRCVAGCVAVAMAQILNYWQWPKTLPDGLPAYEAIDRYDKSLTWHIDSLPPVTFDWDNMLQEYYVPNYSTITYDLPGTEAQQQAVATLMRYCGQAVELMYSPVVSNTYIFQCPNALVNHFGYAAATWVNSREQFGIDEWEDLAYSELAAGRPIIYTGKSPTADAHAFLCDGYDGFGMFHINWGILGFYDGYYSLSVLNPFASTNPYYGSNNLGYTQSQTMIIGLDPSLKELKIPLSDKPEVMPYQLECVDAGITSGLRRIGGNSDITVTIRNNDLTDYIGNIWIMPAYMGHISWDEVTDDTPYIQGDTLVTGAYLRAGQESEVTFLFNPEHGGLVWFDMYYGNYDYLNWIATYFDTVIYSYDSYLVNNSYLTHEGNHYVYHVELCDRPGVLVPDGVPSDSIYLDCRISSADEMIYSRIKLKEEIREYLRALPDNAGSGTYKFTTEVSLDIKQDGECYVWSYLNEWLDDEHKNYIGGAEQYKKFSVTVSPTAIPPVAAEKNQEQQLLYDMHGRRLEGIPQQNGVYINGERKIIVK